MSKSNFAFFLGFLAMATYCYFTNSKVDGVWFLLLAHMLQGDEL